MRTNSPSMKMRSFGMCVVALLAAGPAAAATTQLVEAVKNRDSEAVAALLAVSTGIPLAEMATDWLPAATGAPLLVGGIWVVAFGWFWAGVRGWRGAGLDR